jgi:hypothetical protein
MNLFNRITRRNQNAIFNTHEAFAGVLLTTVAYRRRLQSATICARTAMSYQMKRLHLRDVILILSTACLLMSCDRKGPGAGNRWTGYPSLASSTKTYRWLVVKCQLSDVPVIPAGLDTNIEQFFGISGAGYGNLVDYFHDVSYNHASVISDTFVGWIKAPFGTADLMRFPLALDRKQRVVECLEAIPTDKLPDLDAFYGVVVVNNAVQDGGAAGIGQQQMTINKKSYNLACVWFDPNSLFTGFVGQEIAHGLGLDHSFDDSGRNCGGGPGEYCDAGDIMSALGSYRFPDPNWVVGGNARGGGPGLNAPGLLRMGWIPGENQRHFQNEGDEQTFKIRALSRPRGTEPLVVILDTGSQVPFEGLYTVEYRQADGWDRGFVTSDVTGAIPPPAVQASGGTVLVHQFRLAGAPASTLINGAFAGALVPCNSMVLVGFGGVTFHIRVKSFDLADGSATVSIGFGREKFVPCFSDVVRNPGGIPLYRDVSHDTKIQP